RRSRASSTPRFDAASISTTSRLAAPLQMRRHDAHSPHGSPSSDVSPRRSQLSAIASTRARVVFPTPRGPQRRYPCATLPRAIAPFNVVETCDCTATSANRFGRYLRARARDIRGRAAKKERESTVAREVGNGAFSVLGWTFSVVSFPNLLTCRPSSMVSRRLRGGRAHRLCWERPGRAHRTYRAEPIE